MRSMAAADGRTASARGSASCLEGRSGVRRLSAASALELQRAATGNASRDRHAHASLPPATTTSFPALPCTSGRPYI